MSSPSGYEALVQGTAVVRRTDRSVLRLRGADTVTWLQGLVTNDIAAIATGQRIYSAYLTPQGRMITDLWVVAAAEDLLLDVPAALSAALAARLDALIFAEDVQIDDGSESMAVLHVFGAAAAEGPDTGGVDGVIEVPALEFGVHSYAAYVPLRELENFVSALLRTHAEVGLDALDVVRVEAGIPRFMVDMTEDTIPLEAGIEDRAISFTKGCYVGQEVIVRVTTRGGGRVARKLVGLRLEDGTEPPIAGAAIQAGDRAVGRITSAVFSPRCASVIALGYVHRDFTAPGTSLEVHHDARSLPAVVHALPFVAPTT
jgi:folate-binding protein YgfZ